MAVVLWKYSNPWLARSKMPVQLFTFAGRLVEISQETEADINVDQNTGLKLWDGAYLLAKYVEAGVECGTDFWGGKQCIELGAGCGLVGLVAWLNGAQVTLTDLEDTIPHTEKNINTNMDRWKAKNNLMPPYEKLDIKALSWGKENSSTLNRTYDVILGSDIIYHPDTVVLLLETLDVLSTTETKIFIAYKKRGLGEDIFFDKLSTFSFECSTVSRDNYPQDFIESEYQILKIRKTGK